MSSRSFPVTGLAARSLGVARMLSARADSGGPFACAAGGAGLGASPAVALFPRLAKRATPNPSSNTPVTTTPAPGSRLAGALSSQYLNSRRQEG